MEERTVTDELSDFFLKYKEFIEEQNEQKKKKNDFNVITALLSQSDEVRLHSRFIYSLINPKGKHYKDTLFLEKFLDIMDVKNFNYETVEVKKEYENIDLYITDGCQHIIIENKIHAYDQNHQISRYINTIKESSDDEAIHDSILVVYLTLDYKKPSVSSLNEWRIEDHYLRHNINIEYKIKYKNITYKTDIINWIYSLLKDFNEIPVNVRSAIESYKEVVEKITHLKGNNVMGINDYLLKSDNFDKLLITANLANSFKSIRGKILKQFFVELDKAVECKNFAEKYLEEEIKQFSYDYKDDCCDKWFVGRRKHQNYHVGTFFKMLNMPIVFGLLVAEQNLYFVVRVIGDNEVVDQLFKKDDKYKHWGIIKNNKEAKLDLYWMPFNIFFNTSIEYNIYKKIHQKDILSLLCKKEFTEKVADKMNIFAKSLSGFALQ